MLKRILPPLIAAAALMLATPAIACQLYAGAHTGVAIVDTRTSIAGFQDGAATTSALVGARVGCNYRLDKVVAGVWADADLYRLHDGSPVVIGTSGATLDMAAAFGGKLGYAINPHVTLYGIAGWGFTWVKDIQAGPVSASLPRFQGPVAGGGFETEITRQVHLDLQYRAGFNRAESVVGAPVSIEPLAHSVRLGVNFHFNGEAPKAGKVAP